MKMQSSHIAVFALLISSFLLLGCVLEPVVRTGEPPQPPVQNVLTSKPNASVNATPPAGTLPTPQPPADNAPPAKEGKLEVEKTFYFVKDTNYYHITAILKNTGEYPIKHVRADVLSYLKDGTKNEMEYVVWPARLAPGEYGAFDATIGQEKAYDIGKYTVAPGSFAIDESNYSDQFEIIKDVSVADASSYYKASANIKNIGSANSKNHWVTGIFYDAAGNVLATGTDVIGTSGGIKPGETEKVAFVVAHPTKMLRIADFEVRVEYG